MSNYYDRMFRQAGPSSTPTPMSDVPVPGKRTLTEGMTHSPSPSSDETPVDWRALAIPKSPKNPFVSLEIVPSTKCPQGDTAPWKQQWRRERWWDYVNVAMAIQTMQDNVGPDIVRYQHAETDGQLAALGFIMPKGFQGDLNTLASQQQLPHRGGPQLASLFNADNTLAVTNNDRHAMSKVSQSGVADGGFNKAAISDNNIQAALHHLQGIAEEVKIARLDLQVAKDTIKVAHAQQEAAEAKEEIAGLNEDAERVSSVFEFIDSGPVKMIEFAKTGIEKISNAGSAAAMIVRLFSGEKLQAAQRKLNNAEREITTLTAKTLQHRLEAAMAKVRGMLELYAEAQKRLETAMTERRVAYDEAGTQAAGGNVKIAAIVAAIPVVETVVAAFDNIVTKTTLFPPYTEGAGIGYGIAFAHQLPEALLLPQVIGILQFCNAQFGMVSEDWKSRLETLRAAYEQMAGSRPHTKD